MFEDNFDEVIRDLEDRINRVDEVQRKTLEEICWIVKQRAGRNVESAFTWVDPDGKVEVSKINVNTTNLRNKWNHLVSGDTGSVESGVDYASSVEFGTPPGTSVPIEDLKLWFIRKKKIATTGLKAGKRRVKALSDEERVNTAVYFIHKKIFEEGILPSPFLRPAPYQEMRRIEKVIDKRINTLLI